MSDEPQLGVWQQFRRRRVTRSVITYLAVAFAVVEAAWLLVPYLGLPEWSRRVVLGTVVIGFPLAVVLAWTYDLTASGIVKTPDELGPDAPDPSHPPLARSWWWALTVGSVVAGLIVHFVRQ